MHCNLSLNSNLSERPVSPCLLFFFYSPYPAVLLSSLFQHFASSSPVFTLTVPSPFIFPLSPYSSAPPTTATTATTHGVNQQHLSLISFAPPSGFLTHSIHIGAEGRQVGSWWNSHLSFLGSQLTSGPMNHWMITVCGNVCGSLLSMYIRALKHAFLFLSHFPINHLDVMCGVLGV